MTDKVSLFSSPTKTFQSKKNWGAAFLGMFYGLAWTVIGLPLQLVHEFLSGFDAAKTLLGNILGSSSKPDSIISDLKTLGTIALTILLAIGIAAALTVAYIGVAVLASLIAIGEMAKGFTYGLKFGFEGLPTYMLNSDGYDLAAAEKQLQKLYASQDSANRYNTLPGEMKQSDFEKELKEHMAKILQPTDKDDVSNEINFKTELLSGYILKTILRTKDTFLDNNFGIDSNLENTEEEDDEYYYDGYTDSMLYLASLNRELLALKQAAIQYNNNPVLFAGALKRANDKNKNGVAAIKEICKSFLALNIPGIAVHKNSSDSYSFNTSLPKFTSDNEIDVAINRIKEVATSKLLETSNNSTNTASDDSNDGTVLLIKEYIDAASEELIATLEKQKSTAKADHRNIATAYTQNKDRLIHSNITEAAAIDNTQQQGAASTTTDDMTMALPPKPEPFPSRSRKSVTTLDDEHK